MREKNIRYSALLADRVCEQIATTTVGLDTLCKGEDMPAKGTVLRWVKEHADFGRKYEQARERQATLPQRLPLPYSPEIADKLCRLIATGTRGLRKMRREEGMPGETTVRRWLKSNPEFRRKYEQARAQQELLPERLPVPYRPETADEFCQTIACTLAGLDAICSRKGMPSLRTVLNWLRDDPDFRRKYALAKQLQTDLLMEEILAIADDASKDVITIQGKEKTWGIPNRARISRDWLRVKTRMWLAGQLMPKKYAGC